MLCNEHIELIHDSTYPCTLDCFQTYFETFTWYNRPCYEIFFQRCSTSWIYQYLLDGKYYWQEEYARLLIYTWICDDILDESETKVCSIEYHWGGVLLRNLFGELFEQVLDTIVIYYENNNGIWLVDNLVFHDNSKHIEIQYHYFWDMV